MALTFPAQLPSEIRSAPERDAERRVFDCFRDGLSSDYRVFYSVAWLSRRNATGAWDGEADFVLVHPRRGILVVEVKGGLIRRDGSTGQWWTQPRHGGQPHPIKDPFNQARRSKYHLAETIQGLPRWVSGKPRLGHIVAFPHCDKHISDLALDCPSAIIMYGPDLLRIEAWMEAAYDYWSGAGASCTPVDGFAMQAVVDMLSPSVHLRPTAAIDATGIAGTEATIAQLTSNQEKILRALAKNRRVAIGGGAGTGKTMLALAKAKHLASQGFQTLLTCYNRPLADHLAALAASSECLHVADFHQVCLSALKRAGLKLDNSASSDFWEVQVPNAFVNALSTKPGPWFDAIVVDEAQDFAESWWVPIELALGDSESSVLYVFYDDNQRLYKRAASYPGDMVEYRLCENLRNTVQIHEATTKFYTGEELVPCGPNGSNVEYVHASDGRDQRREVAKLLDALINAGGVRPEDIVILTGRSTESSSVGAERKVGSFRLASDRNKQLPLFESIARFKGLESSVVILCELEDSIDGTRDENVYVGLSRARSSLFVVGSSAVLSYLRRPSDTSPAPVESEYLNRLLGT